MAWIYLFIAGLFEVGWAIGLKYTAGFTKLWPSVLTVFAMIASFFSAGASAQNYSRGHGLRGVDRHWRVRHGDFGHVFVP